MWFVSVHNGDKRATAWLEHRKANLASHGSVLSTTFNLLPGSYRIEFRKLKLVL